MLSLLFDKTFWIGITIAALIVVLIILCVKYPNARFYILGIAGVALGCFTVYCINDLNYYFNAEGGVYGYISSVLGINQAQTEDLTFSLSNIELIQVEGDKYSATVSISDTREMKEGKTYGVFVNGVPVTSSTITAQYIKADYTYTFYDSTLSEMLTDTLSFDFVFYPNYSNLTITTNGGTAAVKQWNSYWSKNNFVVTIEQSPILTSEIVEGDISNYKYLKYYVDDELYNTVVYQEGETVGISHLEEYKGKDVTLWEYIDEAYYAYTYDALDWKVSGSNLVRYTGDYEAVIVPKSYSLFREIYPIAGEDYAITTIGSGCFDSTLKSIIIQDNITSIESGAFYNSVNLQNVFIESYDIYTQLTSTTACGSILQYSTEVQILASIDDGTNELLSDTTKYTKYVSTYEGKEYNRYVEVVNTDDDASVCTVTYYDYYGDVAATQTYNYGDSLVFTTATIAKPAGWTEDGKDYYYELAGWKDAKGNIVLLGQTITSDLELTSVWEVKFTYANTTL